MISCLLLKKNIQKIVGLDTEASFTIEHKSLYIKYTILMKLYIHLLGDIFQIEADIKIFFSKNIST
jgi:hypothetical protein